MEISIVISFIIGVISGVIATILFHKKNVEHEKMISLLVVGLWLCMHTFAFFKGGEVSRLFDIAGLGTVGHIVGLDLPTIINKLRGK